MRKVMSCLASVIAAVMLIGFSMTNVQADPCELPEFNLANFDDPQPNPYFPMEPKTTFVYVAETEDGFIQNEITITNKKKKILGVTCTVIYDVEWECIEEDGEEECFITEETYDWYALDIYRNVWYFGEDTLEYLYDDEGEFIGTDTGGSWEAGVDGARPGIVIPGNPMPGLCYKQEYYEDEAEDVGKVMKLNASVSIEYRDFDECLMMKEWSLLELGNVEHKYYAPGVGLVFIEELKEKTVHVELVEIIN